MNDVTTTMVTVKMGDELVVVPVSNGDIVSDCDELHLIDLRFEVLGTEVILPSA